MESIKLWARNGEAVRQSIELGELVHMETASEELTDAFLLWLLLDSRVVDVTMSYNPICASCILLETLIFQEPYTCVVCFRRPREQKTLKPNTSPSGNCSP